MLHRLSQHMSQITAATAAAGLLSAGTSSCLACSTGFRTGAKVHTCFLYAVEVRRLGSDDSFESLDARGGGAREVVGSNMPIPALG